MREPEEIKALIAKLSQERAGWLVDYQKSNNTSERNILAAILVEKAMCIKHLEWIIEKPKMEKVCKIKKFFLNLQPTK